MHIVQDIFVSKWCEKAMGLLGWLSPFSITTVPATVDDPRGPPLYTDDAIRADEDATAMVADYLSREDANKISTINRWHKEQYSCDGVNCPRDKFCVQRDRGGGCPLGEETGNAMKKCCQIDDDNGFLSTVKEMVEINKHVSRTREPLAKSVRDVLHKITQHHTVEPRYVIEPEFGPIPLLLENSPFPHTGKYLTLHTPLRMRRPIPSQRTTNNLVTLGARLLSPWLNVVLTEDVHNQLTDHLKSRLDLTFKLFVKDLTPSTWKASPHLEVIVRNRLRDASLILTNIVGVLNVQQHGEYRKIMLFEQPIDHPINFDLVLVYIRGLVMTGDIEIYGYPMLFTGITSGSFGSNLNLVSSKGPHHVKISTDPPVRWNIDHYY